ncbi:uncharacterized protein GIQ15_03254 [Arthroderma uncinatum]|uniref:uncharacterized protein n=1 Tax=Arthroderma uncinatum TaxID=74035 RepID=UPI00144A6BC0|nr:uncharacterized protein GIQ15_03254 [Arthroderma uncinatum]KAF3483930.1 hypothetical protein GIQ15_03254 [Arthroderma uncinatum]
MVALIEYNKMGSQQPASDFEWGYLIQADKSPSPRLEQLCLGLAGVISDLDPSSSTKELTPEKLAAFYRAVGGNYDSLFLNTPSPSLSFIYQSLGCFHTLQPTKSAFEPPSIPALLPHGFIRWQTIQLLLCPEEHATFLQRAVEMFDIVDAHEGYLLPKSIPASAFPAHPDPDMVKWHETVSNRLELESAEATPNARSSHSPQPSASTNFQARSRQSKSKDDEGDYFDPILESRMDGFLILYDMPKRPPMPVIQGQNPQAMLALMEVFLARNHRIIIVAIRAHQRHTDDRGPILNHQAMKKRSLLSNIIVPPLTLEEANDDAARNIQVMKTLILHDLPMSDIIPMSHCIASGNIHFNLRANHQDGDIEKMSRRSTTHILRQRTSLRSGRITKMMPQQHFLRLNGTAILSILDMSTSSTTME